MAKRNSHVGKSAKDRARYLRDVIKEVLGEDETFEKGEDSSATDSTASEETQVEDRRELRRPRPKIKKIKDGIKDNAIYILMGLVSILISAVIAMAFALNGISRDIGKLDERTEKIPKMEETLKEINQNIFEFKKGIEYRFKDYDKKIEESEKNKK